MLLSGRKSFKKIAPTRDSSKILDANKLYRKLDRVIPAKGKLSNRSLRLRPVETFRKLSMTSKFGCFSYCVNSPEKNLKWLLLNRPIFDAHANFSALTNRKISTRIKYAWSEKATYDGKRVRFACDSKVADCYNSVPS